MAKKTLSQNCNILLKYWIWQGGFRDAYRAWCFDAFYRNTIRCCFLANDACFSENSQEKQASRVGIVPMMLFVVCFLWPWFAAEISCSTSKHHRREIRCLMLLVFVGFGLTVTDWFPKPEHNFWWKSRNLSKCLVFDASFQYQISIKWASRFPAKPAGSWLVMLLLDPPRR